MCIHRHKINMKQFRTYFFILYVSGSEWHRTRKKKISISSENEYDAYGIRHDFFFCFSSFLLLCCCRLLLQFRIMAGSEIKKIVWDILFIVFITTTTKISVRLIREIGIQSFAMFSLSVFHPLQHSRRHHCHHQSKDK